MNSAEAKFVKFQFGLNMRLSLYKKISAFMSEGIPIHNVVTELGHKYEELKKGDIRSKVLLEISEQIGKGSTFADALSYWAPSSEIMLIKAGEDTGDLDTALLNAIHTTSSAKRMKSTIVAQTAYPAVLLIVLCLLIYGFSTQAVPQLTTVLEPESWPPAAQKLYEMSVFVETKWWVVVLSFFGVVGLAMKSLPIMTGKARKALDYVPPWSIYKTFQGSVFLISVAAMIRSGTPIYDAIEDLQKMSPKYVRDELEKMTAAINQGKVVGAALNQGFLEKEIGIDVEIYGNLANLEKSLERIGNDAIESGIERITASAILLKNLVLLGVATYVGWIYYAFFTLTQSIGEIAGT